jgi:hypothetical protein
MLSAVKVNPLKVSAKSKGISKKQPEKVKDKNKNSINNKSKNKSKKSKMVITDLCDESDLDEKVEEEDVKNEDVNMDEKPVISKSIDHHFKKKMTVKQKISIIDRSTSSGFENLKNDPQFLKDPFEMAMKLMNNTSD